MATLLFEGTPPAQPGWMRWTLLLPVALLASILAVMVTPAAWLAAGVVLFTLMSLQMQYFQQVDEWKGQLDALRLVLATTALLGDARQAGCVELGADARRLYQQLGRAPGGAYADWFALANVRHYFSSTARVFAQREFLRRCYVACGNLEADVAWRATCSNARTGAGPSAVTALCWRSMAPCIHCCSSRARYR